MMHKPLLGVKIVDLSMYVAGPAAARMMGEWGADVIKVEPLKGDNNRPAGRMMGMPIDDSNNPHNEVFNANKRSLALDLKQSEGQGDSGKATFGSMYFSPISAPEHWKSWDWTTNPFPRGTPHHLVPGHRIRDGRPPGQ